MKPGLSDFPAFWMVVFFLLTTQAPRVLGGELRLKYAIQPKVQPKVQEFDLADVRLLDGPFKRAQELDADWLLRIEPDRLLSGFRSEAGLEPKAPRYGGWENMSIAGHSLGHHLSACSLMYAATGDTRFRDRVAYIVNELAACQAANGDGYVAAIPEGKRIFAEVARGEIRSKGFDLNGGWVPWYTIHKLLAGLRDAYLHCDNDQAREVMVKLADWALKTTDNLTDAQLQTMLDCEHGGMNEVAADLYAITGQDKYLTLARRFHHKAVLDPLAEQKDILPGKHANTQIPKLIGCARLYELTGDEHLRNAADFFWRTVIDHHTYVTGGNSSNEYFGPRDQLAARLSGNTTETCNTYNMLKLTRHLFAWTADARYMDYYERALLNHILASQNPRTGAVCYYVQLRTGSRKQFQRLFEDFTCCVGTGMENHATYGQSIYAHDNAGLYVNLYIASELNWRDRGLLVRQETDFPTGETVRLMIQADSPVELTVYLRYPSWATEGMKLSVNSQDWPAAAAAGSYIAIARKWQNGDVIDLTWPMPLRAESPQDDPGKIALFRGPVLLAGIIDEQTDPDLIPALVTDGKPPQQWLKSGDGGLMYSTVGVGKPRDLRFVPFYQVVDQRYGVYWDVFSQQQWTSREAEYRRQQQRLAELERRTVDRFDIGQMQPERDHNLDGQRTRTGEFMGRRWRDCFDGGFFEFDMKVLDGQDTELICTYWGGDSGGREFDILVDGRKIATQKLENNHPGRFFEQSYFIPADLTAGKQKVRLRIQALPGKTGGGLFGCRTVRPHSAASTHNVAN